MTSASSTQLTITSLSGLVVGNLTASVTVNSVSSGAPVQVATVIPVVTSSSANLPANATSLTINGFGFSTTAGNNAVSFSGGATGTVTSASSTQLTITSLSGLVLGNLTASVTVSGVSSGTPVQVATVVSAGGPVVTPSTATLPVTATSMTINGSGFDTTAGNDSVSFSGGATGTVTSASSTQLTVTSLSGLVVGSLNASVTVNGVSSGPAVQVATVIPVVTSSTANLAVNATSMTINGFGFSTTAGNNTVSFSGGATGTVTAATSTQLTVTSLSGLVLGSLTASVTVDGVGSGTAVQVATVIPVVTSSTANLAVNATSITINGFGFDSTAGNDSVTFSNGVTGTVTSASSTQLTVTSLSGLVLGNLTATVTVDGVGSGTAVQVATVIPVVTSSATNLAVTATSMTINGFGFDTTPGNNTVSFSGGATGTVTSATSTQLTVTSLSGLVLGNLSASVTVDGVSSGAAVQVATVVAVPTITVSTNSLNLGTTTVGTAGTAQTYTVSGSNLTANVVVTPPTGVELSLNGSSWQSSETLTPSSGTVPTTTIYARITASASVGSISGNITNTSTGATEQDVAVSGTVNSSLPGGSVTTAQVDDGNVQRSMVRSLTLTFATTITSGQITTILSQLSLTRASDGLSVGLAATLVDATHLKVTFTGSSIIGGSLADGRYTLSYGGVTVLAAGSKGQTDETQYLWRLFGDLYGTASVNAADATAFMAAMNSRKGMSNYSVYFDYDENGIIVNTDQTAFNQRKGTLI